MKDRKRKILLFLFLVFLLFLTCIGCYENSNITVLQIPETETNWSTLHRAVVKVAVDNEPIDTIQSTIDSGEVDINAQTKDHGHTVLHLTALFDRTDIADLLLKNGADTEIKDNHGRTASDIVEVVKRIKQRAPP